MRKRSKGWIKRQKSIHWGGGFFIFCLIFCVMNALYLWGKVHIAFDIRAANVLEEKKNRLEREINDLRVQVNSMKSYNRIVAMAKAQGMVILEPSLLVEMEVDFRGMESIPKRAEIPYHVAGLGLPTLRRHP